MIGGSVADGGDEDCGRESTGSGGGNRFKAVADDERRIAEVNADGDDGVVL
jgi:hypothetical protein